VALVIGNSNYQHGGKLKHPVGDTYLVGFTLEDLGFEVTSKTDASLGEMEDAIRGFLNQLTGNEVAFIYYTGQGIHSDGQNYLVPVDAKLKGAKDLKKEAFNVSEMVEQLGEMPGKVKIVILDACREFDFPGWITEASRGFAEMTAPAGTIVAFGVSPGAAAIERGGANGLYANSLTRQMMIPQSIEAVIKNTGLLVSHSSKGKQCPAYFSSLTGSYSLVEGATPPSGAGSIMLNSALAGNLLLNGLEISTVEPNTVIPLDNMQEGTYELKIVGEETWEENVLVISDQVTHVNARAIIEEEIPEDTKEVQNENSDCFTDSRDMTTYPLMTFGDQTWMTKNLSFDVPGGSYCYDNNPSNCGIYGNLYTWEAAGNACPDGWHLPSDEEWKMLERFIGMEEKSAKKIGLRGKTEGFILRDASEGSWPAKWETGIANGFNALPGGYYLNENKSAEKDKSAVFWTSTEYNTETAYYRKIVQSKGGIHRYYNDKSRGYSVRCLKD
jgi:uncharacterized protein (TIGR02145 family)